MAGDASLVIIALVLALLVLSRAVEVLSEVALQPGTALKLAVETGAGIGVLPDYAVDGDAKLTLILRDTEMPSLDSYLVYAEEMRGVARVQAFRDFLISKTPHADPVLSAFETAQPHI